MTPESPTPKAVPTEIVLNESKKQSLLQKAAEYAARRDAKLRQSAKAAENGKDPTHGDVITWKAVFKMALLEILLSEKRIDLTKIPGRMEITYGVDIAQGTEIWEALRSACSVIHAYNDGHPERVKGGTGFSSKNATKRDGETTMEKK